MAAVDITDIAAECDGVPLDDTGTSFRFEYEPESADFAGDFAERVKALGYETITEVIVTVRKPD